MTTTYTLDQLSSLSALTPPARLAVIGDPIAHSKSPQMHNPALLASGIDAQYVRVQVPEGQVATAFRSLADHGFIGVNVTIPHKQEALQAVDVLDPLAQQLGAVNTVAIRDGKLHGFNTDGPGFLRSVQESFSVDVRDLRILILGAGGGAGAAVFTQCLLHGCKKLLYSNRSPEKALALSQKISQLKAAHIPLPRRVDRVVWDHERLALAAWECDLIVNATSLGMKADSLTPLPTGSILSRHLVYDMVYRADAPTNLIQTAMQTGARHADGLALLLHQGAISYEHWFGSPAPLEIMRAALTAAGAPTA